MKFGFVVGLAAILLAVLASVAPLQTAEAQGLEKPRLEREGNQLRVVWDTYESFNVNAGIMVSSAGGVVRVVTLGSYNPAVGASRWWNGMQGDDVQFQARLSNSVSESLGDVIRRPQSPPKPLLERQGDQLRVVWTGFGSSTLDDVEIIVHKVDGARRAVPLDGHDSATRHSDWWDGLEVDDVQFQARLVDWGTERLGDVIHRPTFALRPNGKYGVNWNPIDSSVSYDVRIQGKTDGGDWGGGKEFFGLRSRSGTPNSYRIVARGDMPAGDIFRASVRGVGAGKTRLDWSWWSDTIENENVTDRKVAKPTVTRKRSGKVGINWDDVAGATHYAIRVECMSSGCTHKKTHYVRAPQSYVILSRPEGETYQARVRAVSRDGKWLWPWSDWTTEEPTPAIAVGAPTLRWHKIEPPFNYPADWKTHTRLYVEWDHVKGATSYNIEVDCVTPCSYTDDFKVRARRNPTVSVRFSRQESYHTYRARVQAVDKYGPGAWSAWVTETERPVVTTIAPPTVQWRMEQWRISDGSLATSWDLAINWAPVNVNVNDVVYYVEIDCTTCSFNTTSAVLGKYSALFIPLGIRPHNSPKRTETYRARVRAEDMYGLREWSAWGTMTQ